MLKVDHSEPVILGRAVASQRRTFKQEEENAPVDLGLLIGMYS
jgi:hypothetical protein